jgi:hypothetical protein
MNSSRGSAIRLPPEKKPIDITRHSSRAKVAAVRIVSRVTGLYGRHSAVDRSNQHACRGTPERSRGGALRIGRRALRRHDQGEQA